MLTHCGRCITYKASSTVDLICVNYKSLVSHFLLAIGNKILLVPSNFWFVRGYRLATAKSRIAYIGLPATLVVFFMCKASNLLLFFLFVIQYVIYQKSSLNLNHLIDWVQTIHVTLLVEILVLLKS